METGKENLHFYIKGLKNGRVSALSTLYNQNEKKKKKTERRINDILNIRAMQFTTAAKRRYLAVCTSKFRTRALCMSSHQKGDRYKIHTLILLKRGGLHFGNKSIFLKNVILGLACS